MASFANFGIGLGALAQGLGQGMQLGQQIKQVRNENEIEDLRRQGLEDARLARQADVNSRIEAQGLPGMQGQGGFGEQVAGSFNVGDQSYQTKDQARIAAGKNVDGVMDYFMRDAAPQIAEGYVAQGDIEKAEAWNNWVKDRRSQKSVKDWSNAFMAAQTGNWDAAAKGFGEYYTDYIDDNVDFIGHKTLSDGSGNVTGFTIKLKDNDTGKTSEMPLAIDELVNLGMAQNPQALFENAYELQKSAAERRVEIAAADREAARDFQYESRGASRDQGYDLEKITAREQAKAANKSNQTREDFEANARILRQNGFSDAEIRELAPRILGIANTRAEASETDLRAQALKMLTDEASGYNALQKFNALSTEEQEEKIGALVDVIIGSRGQRQRQQPANPAAGGIPIISGDGTTSIYSR